ncbi:hypothetical protein LH67_13935 [Xenorhabdus nematophila]|nr:hypothetical protein LH67_13935 [Xenorhabdus nematophila]
MLLYLQHLTLFFGSIIANSYLPVDITENIVTRDVNSASTPKSSGVYNLVKIGLIAIGIACAIVEPVINVKIFLDDLFFMIIV